MTTRDQGKIKFGSYANVMNPHCTNETIEHRDSYILVFASGQSYFSAVSPCLHSLWSSVRGNSAENGLDARHLS
jgi:hypothetical protein